MPKILLVEDNELNREMLSRRLVRKGFEVVIAVDGLQGVALAGAERPDLVLMDMSLPGIDGWEATRRLKADAATRMLPVIALTAHAMSDDRAKAVAAGCDDFDTKPVDLERLLGKIDSLLRVLPGQGQTPQGPATAGHAPPGPPPQDAPSWAIELRLPAEARSLPPLLAALDDLCTRAAIDREVRADLHVVLDEVCANIFKHAYAPGASGSVQLTLRHLGAQTGGPSTRPAAIELIFCDQGRPFDPLTRPAPDLNASVEERPIGGLGIHLVRQLTHSQHYSHSPELGNRLTLVKHLSAAASPHTPTRAP